MAFYPVLMGHVEWRVDQRGPCVQRQVRDADLWKGPVETGRFSQQVRKGLR